MKPFTLALVAAASLTAACATTQTRARRDDARTATQPRQLRGEEFRVVGPTDTHPGDAYDAQTLFERGNDAVRAHHCDEALVQYDRLVREFASSRIVPIAEFNRGVCLQSMARGDDAVLAYRAAAERTAEHDLARDAWFRMAAVGESAQQPATVLEATHAVLALPSLSIADRVEALAREAAARLAQNDRPGAMHAAEQAIALVPNAEAISALGDDTYIAEARFVPAEASRLDAQDLQITVSEDSHDTTMEDAITRRIQLVTHAHVLYNDAIRVGNPHWAAASGYSIGAMYRALYDAIVNARMPADWTPASVEAYRRHAGARLRGLLTGALRAWEATQSMAQRNGIVDNDWVRRTDAQIGELRELVLNGGVPAHGAAEAAAAPDAGPERRVRLDTRGAGR